MADELNFQIPTGGFDSYLKGIIPDDQAVLAGAFSVAMQQIRDVSKADITRFAQVAYSMENMAGLPFANGTDVPTDIQRASFAKTQTALGAGIYGTWTMSNFFGCMSGLPYPLKNILEGIQQLETAKLRNIYQEMYLAVTLDCAEITITQNVYNVNTQAWEPADPFAIPPFPGQPRIDKWYYTVDFSISKRGGGYSRGGAPAPTITFSPNNCGASAKVSVNTTTTAIDRDLAGEYGKINSNFVTKNLGSPYLYATTSNYLNNTLPPQPPVPVESVTIQGPPIAYLPVQTSGAKAINGVNTTGVTYSTSGSSDYSTVISTYWPTPMNSVIGSMSGSGQGYIKQANDEIQNIKTASGSNFEAANVLNANWNATGISLKQEHRARIDFFPPVPIPYDRWLSTNPTALYVFVDSIPELGMNTDPHMQAQTLEHISNLKNVGGQSIIGLMRESRNKERLAKIGIALDNNIPNKLDDQLGKLLLTAGVLPGAVEGIPSKAGVDYTIPSNPFVESPTGGSPCDLSVTTEVLSPKPVAFFDPNLQKLRQVLETGKGNISVILNNTVLGPFGNGAGPVFLVDGKLPPGLPPPLSQCGEPPPPDIIINPSVDDNGDIVIIIVNPEVPIGDSPVLDNDGGVPDNLNKPPTADDVVPPNLDSAYTSTTLVPNTYDVNEAIDKVIECNCDCWVN